MSEHLGMKYDNVRKRLKNYDKQKTSNTQLKSNIMNALIRQAGYNESNDVKNPDKGVMNELCKELQTNQSSSMKIHSKFVDARYGRGSGNRMGGFGSGYTFYCPSCKITASSVSKVGKDWVCGKCGTKCEGKKRF